MFAAVKAKGTTIIKNAAKEPEIPNIADMLNKMGAKITGAGTDTITIEGVEYLHSCKHAVLPDRIEAGTYIILGAACASKLKVTNLVPKHIDSLLEKLKEMNVKIKVGKDYVVVKQPKKVYPTEIITLVYPGFPTDLQQVLASLMVKAKGESEIDETIWENRFLNLYELGKMGAKIEHNLTNLLK